MNGLRSAELLLKRLPGGLEVPDPGDVYLIAMALVSGADFLVTGDRALLSMKRIDRTKIVSARRFAAVLGQ